MDEEMLTARLFFRAAFPVMKVPLQDDPATRKAWQQLHATVQFSADTGSTGARRVGAHSTNENRDGGGMGTAVPSRIGACLRFADGELSVSEGLCDSPDLTLHFPSVKAMNTLLRGGMALPRIRGGLRHPVLLVRMLGLLMKLTLMLPSKRPRKPHLQYLKVKMTLYMITTALSVYNKLGSEDMQAWTRQQPDRIYQFTVEPYDEDHGIAAYLRVKGGRSKAGRGVYRRRSPFVHFRFSGVPEAMRVLLKEVGFVEGVEEGYVAIDGSPEYSSQLNDFMQILQARMT